jgi:ribosomal protein S18 acetylase RimI-like enzyme
MIRDARPEEYRAVGDLRVTAYQAVGTLSEGSAYAETLRALGFGGDCVVLVAVDQAEGGDGVVLVAAEEAGNGILGTITLEPFGLASELARDETEADIRAFGVAPEAQGRGVGRKLLLAAIESAERRGLCRLRLCTQPAMEVAQRLYETTGFSRTPDLDFEPVPGIILRAYELALPARITQKPTP